MTREQALQELARYREQIDAIDRQLLALLNQRTRVVEEIGRVKQQVAMPVYEPRREQDVFRNVSSNNGGPLSTEALQRIFERIIDEMRSLQHMRRRDPEQQGDDQC